jgi:hypothetical protein
LYHAIKLQQPAGMAYTGKVLAKVVRQQGGLLQQQ